MYLQNNTLLQGGKYKIVRFIASGGFGCTYEAHHTLLDVRVALKEFFVSDFCNRDEATGQVTVGTQSKVELISKLKKKFLDEARSLFQMHHRGIVRVIDVFEENGTAYYAMEYIDGQSLGDVVKKQGKLPEEEAIGYILQVAEALKYVHGLNRLHLDIKPGNIMLNKEGKAVLIDFGASKHYDDETGENTSTLLGINTKGYAPVEQVNQSFKSFSPATDIYALGATLYKLLTGITPPPSTMLNSEEATLTPLPSSTSTATRQAVEAAMQLLRKNRPQTIDAWTAMLTDDEATNVDVDESKSAPRQEPQSQPLKAHTASSPLQRKKLKWVIAGVVAVFIIAVAIWFPLSSGSSEANDNDSILCQPPAADSLRLKEVTQMFFQHSLGDCSYTGTVDEMNLPHGKGVATWPSGVAKQYDGQWVHGVMEGECTYTLHNGDVFQGAYKAGKYYQGRYTLSATGEYFEGSYKDGNPYRGICYDKNGNIIRNLIPDENQDTLKKVVEYREIQKIER